MSNLAHAASSANDVPAEIVYGTLRTPQGEHLRAIATTGDLSHRTAWFMAHIVYNAKPRDPGTFVAVAALLIFVALAACGVPAATNCTC